MSVEHVPAELIRKLRETLCEISSHNVSVNCSSKPRMYDHSGHFPKVVASEVLLDLSDHKR